MITKTVVNIKFICNTNQLFNMYTISNRNAYINLTSAFTSYKIGIFIKYNHMLVYISSINLYKKTQYYQVKN